MNTNTAQQTLSRLADDVDLHTQPAPRAHHLSATLRQIAEIGGDLPLSAADAMQGYLWIGQPYESDDGPIIGRRTTCRELSEMLARAARSDHDHQDQGNPSRLADVFDAVIAALDASADPRHRSIVITSRREVDEIRRLANVV